MKRLIRPLIAVLALLVPLRTFAQVTSNIFERVLDVRVFAGTDTEATATAFTVDVDGREYLITAKHVVEGLKDKDKIDVFMNDNWAPLAVDIFRCDDSIDIAVLIPPRQLTVNFDLHSTSRISLWAKRAISLGSPTVSGLQGLESTALTRSQ